MITMSHRKHARPMIAKPRKTERQNLRCAICGSSKDVQRHHLGCRNHAPYFTIPLCRKHHESVTALIRMAETDVERYTSDKAERLRRARLAAYVFLVFVDQQMEVPK